MQDAQAIFSFLGTYVTLSESDQTAIMSLVNEEQYDKGEIVIRTGQQSTKLRFALSGVYRIYRLEDDKEITTYFSYPERNPVVASFVSLLTKKTSVEQIECIVPGKVLTISYSEWEALYERSATISKLGRKMAEYNYILAMERIASLQFQSAGDRYQLFLKQYPQLFNLIPHYYIASYLGVTPESLSRIRKEAVIQ